MSSKEKETFLIMHEDDMFAFLVKVSFASSLISIIAHISNTPGYQVESKSKKPGEPPYVKISKDNEVLLDAYWDIKNEDELHLMLSEFLVDRMLDFDFDMKIRSIITYYYYTYNLEGDHEGNLF